MKRLTAFALAGTLLLAILFVSLKLFGGPTHPPKWRWLPRRRKPLRLLSPRPA